MLSGIGNGESLRTAGMDVKHHLPGVGANYHDHLAAGVLMEMSNSESYGLSLRAAPRGAWNLLEYALFRRGPLASNLFEATAFVRSLSGLDRPDLQIVFQPARRNPGSFPIPLGHGFAVSVVHLYPKSRGRVTLASPDPHVPPAVDPNLLGDPADLPPMLRGLALARRIVAASAFERYRAVEVQPGPAVQREADLAEYVRRVAATVHHPCGSCRMGTDAGAVVDPELSVHGIAGLRVVDASVFPQVVGGNTNAAVVMVAERAADMMLGMPMLRPFEQAFETGKGQQTAA
jgi:choline dehydrogenase-like flavoprotein